MNRLIKLDAINSGIAVYLFTTKNFLKGNAEKQQETGKYIIMPDKIKLFKNTETARAFLHSKLNIDNPYDYKFCIYVDGESFDYDNCEYIQELGYYEYYSGNDCYFIQEENINKVLNIGYFTFSGVDANRYGNEVAKELLHDMKNVIGDIVRFPNSYPTFNRISTDKNNHLVGYVKGSTAQFHILTNSQIIDLNAIRKDYGLRCVPYLKDMDKFKTIFFYVTKDINDYSDHSIDEKIGRLTELIVEIANNKYPDLAVSYIPVEFKGTITDNYR